MFRQGENSLQYAEQLLREGKKQEALSLLAGYLRQHPNSAQGWWLLSFAIPDVKKQIECVERVLHIDSNNAPARARLEKLRGNASIPPPIPPFVDSVSPNKPEAVSERLPKQDSQPSAIQKPMPGRKANRRVLQYSVLAVMVCAAVGVLGFVAVMIAQGRIPMQSAQPASFTQISLPPTWTPTPTATRIASLTPYSTITPLTLPTLNVSPTSPVPRSQVGPLNGYYAPNFSLNNVNNNAQTSLSDYEGQAVIIFFWATWCPYCKAEMPALQMIYQTYKDRGLTVLAVDVGENASQARNYRDAHSLTFPILDDAGRDVSSAYQVTAFPAHFFVDPSGVISSINIGGLDYWTLNNKVKAMLGLP